LPQRCVHFVSKTGLFRLIRPENKKGVLAVSDQSAFT
jgi:hypothetical protein